MQDVDLGALYGTLIDTVQSNDPDADVGMIYRAYLYSKRVHEGQKRKSGEPYITHPLAVAQLLADMEMDPETISTGLLHDTIEDTLATKADISRECGDAVAEMVEGLSKISKLKFGSSEQAAAENFRKMIFAMADDMRVIIVKLCDRTHNMNTLEHMPAEKQRRIAQETLDIYAPMANRLGISNLKIQLENLSFFYLHPDLYRSLEEDLQETEEERQAYIGRVTETLETLMTTNHVHLKEVSGRLKHIYSIHKKMVKKNIGLDRIYDIVAFRIVVDNLGDCYQALGVVHGRYKPIPERFKDFIAVPKFNGYQSLHTTVMGPEGNRIEVQIRTQEMHEVAELGIAAHWHYKEGNKKFKGRDMERMRQVRQLYESAQNTEDAGEFMEELRGELFNDEVYVFTPKGEVLALAEGATPLDFAYSVHTEVGHKTVGARVNGRQVNLRYVLQNGEAVEIQTSNTQRPNPDWLNIAQTPRARSKIRSYLRKEERERGKELGQEILEKEMRRRGKNLSRLVKEGSFSAIVGDRTPYKTMEDLYYAVSVGKVTADSLLEQIAPKVEPKKEGALEGLFKRVRDNLPQRKRNASPVRIKGEGDIMVNFAKCCNPLHGDPISGLITMGRGIIIHAKDCPNLLNTDPERRLEVEWETGGKVTRAVMVRVSCSNKAGLLATLTKAISSQDVNIRSADARGGDDGRAVCNFEVLVTDREALTRVMMALERVKGVRSVERIREI